MHVVLMVLGAFVFFSMVYSAWRLGFFVAEVTVGDLGVVAGIIGVVGGIGVQVFFYRHIWHQSASFDTPVVVGTFASVFLLIIAIGDGIVFGIKRAFLTLIPCLLFTTYLVLLLMEKF